MPPHDPTVSISLWALFYLIAWTALGSVVYRRNENTAPIDSPRSRRGSEPGREKGRKGKGREKEGKRGREKGTFWFTLRWVRRAVRAEGNRKVECPLFPPADKQAARVATLTELKWLVLMDTQLTDVGLRHLTALRKLERLDLEGGRVTDMGVKDFKRSLPNVKVFY